MKAVLIIDMLNDFFREGPLVEAPDELTSRINGLIGAARTADMPIIWVRQEFSADLSDAFLAMRKRGISICIEGTEGCELLSELDRHPSDYEVIKKRYSAFYQTNLDELIRELGIRELVIAGINTHACVRMAAIDAYQRDLKVDIASDCVASYDAEHHDVSLRYLGRDIARVAPLAVLFPPEGT